MTQKLFPISDYLQISQEWCPRVSLKHASNARKVETDARRVKKWHRKVES